MHWGQAADVARLPVPPDATGQPAAVAEHLRSRYEAARRAPGSIGAVGPMCLAYHADMFFDAAERCYAVAAELDPGGWRWTYYRALIDAERGGSSTLAETLRQVVARAPDFGPAWLRLGDAELKAGRYDAAAEAWLQATRLPDPVPLELPGVPVHVIEVPTAAYAALGLARVALIQGQPERARAVLEDVVEAVPHFGPALRLLADSYRQLGQPEAADRAVYLAGRLPAYAPPFDPLVDALALESRNSTLLLRLASEASLSENAAWSEYLTRRALEFDPENPEVVFKLARVLRTVGRNDEALEHFRHYHEMVPGDFQVLANIGSTLSALGRYEEAESYFRRALAGLDDPVTHYNLGLLMAVTGRLDEAVEHYERALERDPMHSDARSNLAAALVRQGNLARAAHELTGLLAMDPDNARARTNLGLVMLEQGRPAQAAAAFKEALRLDPGLSQAAEALALLER
jgi:tetratricopeptide (TPR) repeat protein